jgi:hypothetical protein
LPLFSVFTFAMNNPLHLFLSSFIATGMLSFCAPSFAQVAPSKSDMQKCAKSENELLRLACFDALQGRTQGATAASAPIKGMGLWQVTSERSKTDNSITSFTALLQAPAPITIGSKASVPKAIARCQEGDLDFYISWGAVVGTTDHEVSTRLDAEDARVGSWSVSTDHTATFYGGDTKALLEGLANAKKLVVRTTPSGGKPLMATFNPTGFSNVLPDILKTCEKFQMAQAQNRKELEAARAEEEKRLKDAELAKAQEERVRKEFERKELEIAKAEEDKLRKAIEAAKAEEEKRRKEIEIAKAEEEKRRKEIEIAKAEEEKRRKDIEIAKAEEEKRRKEIEIAKAAEELRLKEIALKKVEEELRLKEIALKKALAEEEQRQKALEADRLRQEQAQSEKLRKDALERALKQAETAVSSDDLKKNVSDPLVPLTEK